MQQIQVSDYVDIFGIVYSMRKGKYIVEIFPKWVQTLSYLWIFSRLERVWMVQTEQQYICIHQCLMAVLEGKENSGPPREIHDNQGYEGEYTSINIKLWRTFGSFSFMTSLYWAKSATNSLLSLGNTNQITVTIIKLITTWE